MYRSFISLRYLRARRTNWIGVGGIFLAVSALILILSIMSGFIETSRTSLRGGLSDIVIQPLFDYFTHAPKPERLLPEERGSHVGLPLEVNAQKALGLLRDHPDVEAACVQLQWYGMVSRQGYTHKITSPLADGHSIVQLVGIDVADEYTTTDLLESLEREPMEPDEGDPYLPQRPADPQDPFAMPAGYMAQNSVLGTVLVGEQLGRKFNLRIGDSIKIFTAVPDKISGEIQEGSDREFLVAGTFRSKNNQTDAARIYFEREELADFLGWRSDYSTMLVKLKDFEATKERLPLELTNILEAEDLLHARSEPARGGGHTIFREVRTWEQYNRTMIAAIENEKVLMGIMLSLVLVVAGFTIFAILSMTVTEKKRDIGVICALGGTQRGVLALFLWMGFWEALVGTVGGGIVGILAAINIDAIERGLSSTFGVTIFNRKVYLFDHIPSVIEPMGIAMIIAGAFLSTLLFAALPAIRAARLNPIDALRYE